MKHARSYGFKGLLAATSFAAVAAVFAADQSHAQSSHPDVSGRSYARGIVGGQHRGTYGLNGQSARGEYVWDRYGVPARKSMVYTGTEAPGKIILDFATNHLYMIDAPGHAWKYVMARGGESAQLPPQNSEITKMVEWPRWTPTNDQRRKNPYLPAFVEGGPSNPLGAAALYMGETTFRIHGTNQPSKIGGDVSSGCIRLTNEDIQLAYLDAIDLKAKGYKITVTVELRGIKPGLFQEERLKRASNLQPAYNVKIN